MIIFNGKVAGRHECRSAGFCDLRGLYSFDDLGPGGSGDDSLMVLDVEVQAVEPGLVVQATGGVVALGVGLGAVSGDLGESPDKAFVVGVGDVETA